MQTFKFTCKSCCLFKQVLKTYTEYSKHTVIKLKGYRNGHITKKGEVVRGCGTPMAQTSTLKE